MINLFLLHILPQLINYVKLYANNFISMGSRTNLEEVAKNLFISLREADKTDNELILIEGTEIREETKEEKLKKSDEVILLEEIRDILREK